MATLPPLDRYRRNWLAQAELSESLDADRCGLGFFFYDPVELAAFREIAAVPDEAAADGDALHAKYELIPRRWIKLHFEAGQAAGLSEYFVLDPANRWPITTLRLAVRRYGHDPQRLETALLPALEQDSAMWAVIVKRRCDGAHPVVRLSCHVERARLPALAASLVAEGYIEHGIAQAMLEADAQMEAADSAYVTVQPGEPQICALDFKTPHPMPGVRYLKWRPTRHGPSWSAYRPLPRGLSEAQLEALCELPTTDAADYYDSNCARIVRDVGTIYQAALLPGDPARTVLQLAREADVRPGMRILDAGCGVGGPAIVLASAIEDLEIDAITSSAMQAREAVRSVAAASVEARVRVVHGDYHALPYDDGTFDRALFFESFGYAADLARLAAETHRVLKPGGRIFIKDAFQRAEPLSAAERLELAEFNQVYAFRAPTVERTLEALRAAGFTDVEAHPLECEYDLERFYGAMGVSAVQRPVQVTEFGRLHYRRFENLPVAFHRIAATKP